MTGFGLRTDYSGYQRRQNSTERPIWIEEAHRGRGVFVDSQPSIIGNSHVHKKRKHCLKGWDVRNQTTDGWLEQNTSFSRGCDSWHGRICTSGQLSCNMGHMPNFGQGPINSADSADKNLLHGSTFCTFFKEEKRKTTMCFWLDVLWKVTVTLSHAFYVFGQSTELQLACSGL